MRLKLLGVAALLAATGSVASAQSAPETIRQCEVHVYPADGPHSVGEDFDNVHEFDQDLRHYYDMAGAPLNWLNPARQLELMRGSRLAEIASPGASTTVFHPEPLTRRQALDLPPTTSGACVVDVLLPQILLERGGLSPRSLRVFGMVRTYERGVLVKRYSGYASAPMDGFQLRSPADASAATRLVEAAYVRAVETMLHNSTKTKK